MGHSGKVTASMSASDPWGSTYFSVINKFRGKWVSLVVDIGALMSGVKHMMRLIWGLFGV